MKIKNTITLLGALALTMGLSACGENHKPAANTPKLDISNRIVDFSKEMNPDFFASSGFGNGGPFNVTWNSENVDVTNNELHLSISEANSGDYPYYGGELRSRQFFGYGDYAVSMKPAKSGGTASTFFLYTGEWDSENLHPSTGYYDTRNPNNNEGKHDEIDIEFLGKNTRKVQFNYFTNGKGGNEYMYDLGFDASEEWHTYGFRYEEGRITWFVDEKPVYTATKNVPSHPARMIANYWCGSKEATNWMGNYDKDYAKYASYQWMSASVQGTETHKQDADPTPTVTAEFDWAKIDAVPFTDVQGNTDTYTHALSDDGLEMDVTYTNVGQNWNNLNVAIPESAKNARKLAFEVENKGDAEVAVRGNANAATTHGENNISAVNESATQDGQPVNTDLSWGGSFFTIGAGKTALCEITYSEEISRLEFMIDSHIAGTQSGHIVIKNLKFSDNSGTVDQPDTINWNEITPVKLEDVQGNDDVYSYILSDDELSMEVSYVDVGQNWNNLNVAIPASVKNARTLSFEVENLGDATVAVRGNANAATTHGENNITAVNESAKQDGKTVSTDLSWGGSFFSVAAGKTSLCEITYSEEIVRLEFMMDSHIAGTQSGHLIIKNLRFLLK